jgi:hypothetical protein
VYRRMKWQRTGQKFCEKTGFVRTSHRTDIMLNWFVVPMSF